MHDNVHWAFWNQMTLIFLQPTVFNNAYSVTTRLTVAGKPLHTIICLMGNDTLLVTMGCSMTAYRYAYGCEWGNEDIYLIFNQFLCDDHKTIYTIFAVKQMVITLKLWCIQTKFIKIYVQLKNQQNDFL